MNVAAAPDVPNYGIDSDRLLARDPVIAALRRRWRGEYAVDEFGGDPHLQDFLVAPVVGRIPMDVDGAGHVPASGPALLVVNRGATAVEPIVASGAVQRSVRRRLRIVGLPALGWLGPIGHKLGGVGRRGDDVAAVLRAGHLAAVALAPSWLGPGAGEAPRGVLAATLGVPVVPVAVSGSGPRGVPLGRWQVRIGAPLLPPAGTASGDPLAAAELAQAVRAAVAELLAS